MNKQIVFDKPFKYRGKGKYKYSVYVRDSSKKRGYTKINFGHSDYKHNYSKKARESYLARAKGIRDKNGNLTYKNKLSANYWSVRYLWNGP